MQEPLIFSLPGPSFPDSGGIPLDTVIDRIPLADIADQITNWRRLAVQLGLSRQQEKDIALDYRDNQSMQKRECLEEWKTMKGSGATYQALIIAAKATKDMELAEYILDVCATRQH